jgi:hypothetical protein
MIHRDGKGEYSINIPTFRQQKTAENIRMVLTNERCGWSTGYEVEWQF